MIDWEYMGSSAAEYLLKAAVSSGIILGAVAAFLAAALLLQLVTLSLRRRWYDLLGERSWILLAAPGTVVHETGHALFCLIFRHRILEMKLFAPAPDGTMGMVSHSWDSKSFFQRTGNFFIGTGPIFTGTCVIALLTALLLPEVWEELLLPEVYSFSDLGAALLSLICRMIRTFCSPEVTGKWQTWVWVLATLLIGSHVTLSREDLKNALSGFFFIPLGILLFNLAAVWFTDPGTLLLKYCSGYLICTLAVLIFIIIILGCFTLFLHLPVFQPPPPEKEKSAKKRNPR